MKKLIILLLMSILVLSGCGGGTGNAPTASPKLSQPSQAPTPTKTPISKPESTFSKGEKPMVEIVLENGGVLTAELYPDVAPITVANFLKLVDAKFYDGLIFHRVIPGFMIQGGGFTQDGQQKPADSIKGEFASNNFRNDLKHTRGVLSMARTSVKDSASSQFFVMVADASSLDGEYAAFGKVISGMEYADQIVNQKRDSQDKPITDQVIKTIKRK